jgi:cation diffusion facilitator CzcD-associated flavoprotein CzcO
MPTYEGMATFTGEAIHSKDYKAPSQVPFGWRDA